MSDTTPSLHCAVVVAVREGACDVVPDAAHAAPLTARFASVFPTPHTERVQPGHLVALATAADGTPTVVWRWYDAVVVGHGPDTVSLWEPAHGEVQARPRPGSATVAPGSRAWASAGLPGADWWVNGPVVADPRDAEVELDEVVALFTRHDLWGSVG